MAEHSTNQGCDHPFVKFLVGLPQQRGIVYTKFREAARTANAARGFVGFTFLGFFLFETLTALRIHPIQYLAIGTALAVFYLLVLSLAEHFGFGFSYLAASAVNVLLITGYCKTLLGKTSSLSVLALSLSGLYSFLYVLLQLEDYALLIGSLAVFISLALFMYLTRSLDWYQVSLRADTSEEF